MIDKNWIQKQSDKFLDSLSIIFIAKSSGRTQAVIEFDSEIEAKLVGMGFSVDTIKAICDPCLKTQYITVVNLE